MNQHLYLLILVVLVFNSCSEKEPELTFPILEGTIEIDGKYYSVERKSSNDYNVGSLEDNFSYMRLDKVDNFGNLLLGIHLNDSLIDYIKVPKPSVILSVDSAKLYEVLMFIKDSFSIANNVVQGDDKVCFACYTNFTKPGISLTLFTHYNINDNLANKIIYSTAYSNSNILNNKITPLNLRTEELPVAITADYPYVNTTVQIIRFDFDTHLFDSTGDSIKVKGNLEMFFYAELDSF